MTKNLATWERGLSVGTGAALLLLATRQSRGRLALTTTATGLIARGLAGYCPVTAAVGMNGDTRQALGGPAGVRVRANIVVARPIEVVYAAWRDLTNLPTFLSHVESVDHLEDGRTHWVVKGPGGVPIEWDAEIINDLPNELVAWRSVGNATVVSAGSVRFEPTSRGGTEVRVHLQYAPPAGRLGSWMAGILGADPERQIREDLRRFKHRVEAGMGSLSLA